MCLLCNNCDSGETGYICYVIAVTLMMQGVLDM